MSKVTNIILAVSLASVGSITQAIGYILQKKGHYQVNEANANKEQDEPNTTYLKNCIWLSGFGTYTVGSILIAAALKFGAQSLVSPLGALTLVANTLLATKYLGEPFEKNDIWGILLVIIGSIITVAFGPKSEGPDPSLDELQQYVGHTAFVIFIIILSAVVLLDFIGIKYYERKNFMDDDNEKIRYGKNFLMVSYVSLAAYFASINVLFIKTLVIILATFNIDYFTKWLLYLDVIGIVIVNVLLEFFRQRALAYFDALFVVPIYQVLLIIGSSMLGAVFFSEFSGLEAYELVLFVIGILITLFGVAIMAFNVGKLFTQELIKVAFCKADKVWDDHDVAFPVWAGFWAIIFQDWYLKHDAFFFNEDIDAAEGLLKYSLHLT